MTLNNDVNELYANLLAFKQILVNSNDDHTAIEMDNARYYIDAALENLSGIHTNIKGLTELKNYIDVDILTFWRILQRCKNIRNINGILAMLDQDLKAIDQYRKKIS